MDSSTRFQTISADSTQHEALAIRWAQYNSASGRASTKQVIAIMRQLNQIVLSRMLAERGIDICADCGDLNHLRRGPENEGICASCMKVHDQQRHVASAQAWLASK